MGNKTYCKELIDSFGSEILQRSCLMPDGAEDYLTTLLNGYKPKVILEIGTYNGVTTAFLAKFPFVERVITVDINRREETKNIWSRFNVVNKISYLLVKNDHEKANLLKNKNINFVLLDGDHTYKGVKTDFNIAKNLCDKILFHDYTTNPHVTTFLKEINKDLIDKRPELSFALWKKPEIQKGQ